MKTESKVKMQLMAQWMLNECDDEMDVNFEWENFLSELDEIIKTINPNGYWKAEVENSGWRKLNGYAYFQANTGKSFLHNLLPKTECHFKIFKQGNTLKVQNYHHDSPMGDEWYTLKSITEKQYNKEH